MALMAKTDPRIDAYIRKTALFAQPILNHIRAAVHAGCPDVEETMKWSMPHFDYKGMFCGMAAFKQHATFGFWKAKLLADQLPDVDKRAMGQFGCIRSLDDLPGRAELIRLVKAATKLNDAGVKVERRNRTARTPLKTPAFVMAALKKDTRALTTYRALSPSHKREYVEWVTEAKQEQTRKRRLAQAIERMAAGKARNWKYER